MGNEYIELNLKRILDTELNIKPYPFIEECMVNVGKVREGTIYDLYNGKSKRIHLDTLAKIIKTLNIIADRQGKNLNYNVEDLLNYKEK
ncbi:helix-turn-helix domain-containing protein [Niallia sp. 03190]|uniref:helix-turn-helix domain-containing protein n=1 Tax=Niallia sp. 03190 TaxID=3458061 RepID=UPI0040446935